VCTGPSRAGTPAALIPPPAAPPVAATSIGCSDFSWNIDNVIEHAQQQAGMHTTAQPQPAAVSANIIEASHKHPSKLTGLRNGPVLNRLTAFAVEHPGWRAAAQHDPTGENLQRAARQAAAHINGDLFHTWGLRHSPKRGAVIGWAQIDRDDHPMPAATPDKWPNSFEFEAAEQKVVLCEDPLLVIVASPDARVLCDMFTEHYERLLAAWEGLAKDTAERCREALETRVANPDMWQHTRRQTEAVLGAAASDGDLLRDAAKRLLHGAGFVEDDGASGVRHRLIYHEGEGNRARAYTALFWVGVERRLESSDWDWVGGTVRFDGSGPNRNDIGRVVEELDYVLSR